MFHVTPAASREILAAAERSQAQGLALRVAARLDTKGEVAFGLGFDEPREDDSQADFHGLQVLVGAPSRPLLADMVLDFAEVEPGRRDFVFVASDTIEPTGCSSKPAAARGGCGSGGCGSCGA
jgi:iron-sulfur cluster assembly protein